MKINKMKVFLALICVVLLSVSVLSGCSMIQRAVKDAVSSAAKETDETDSASSTSAKSSSNKTAAGNTGGFTITDSSGNTVSWGTSDLPKGYPTNTVPIIGNSTIILSGSSTDNNQQVYSVTFTTTKSISDTKNYYKNIYDKFSDGETFTFGTITNYSGKRDGYECNVSITENSSSGEVTVMIALTKDI